VSHFLAERAELQVSFEEIDTPSGEAERPVARTSDGDKADVSDFPSGKNDRARVIQQEDLRSIQRRTERFPQVARRERLDGR